MTADETYFKLYEDNQDLEVFYKCAVLGKQIQRNLKMKTGYTSSERNDMLFYLLYGTVADILRKGNITPMDIKEMDLGDVTEQRIGEIRDRIYDAYKQQGGNINFMFLLEGAPAPDHAAFARFRSIHFAPCSKKI